MTFDERWNMILEGALGQPATAEQKAMFEAGIGAVYVMQLAPGAWEAMTPTQRAEMCVDYVHTHLVNLAKQHEYNTAMKAASDSAKSVEDDLAQVPAPSSLPPKPGVAGMPPVPPSPVSKIPAKAPV